MGMLLYFLAPPVLGFALVAWAAATRRLPDGPRRAALVATILLACGIFTLVRTEGHERLLLPWISTGDGRRLPRSVSWPRRLATPRARAED